MMWLLPVIQGLMSNSDNSTARALTTIWQNSARTASK